MVAEPVISTQLIEKPATGYDLDLLYHGSSPILTSPIPYGQPPLTNRGLKSE
jgi:hypothetical protein